MSEYVRYVYQQSEAQLWTVGYYTPGGRWVSESDHSTKQQAAERVHWLNGGKEDSDECRTPAA